MRYLKDNWPHLLLSLLVSLAASGFALGCAWATLGDRVANAERRLNEVDKARVAETRWQVEQDAAALVAVQADAKQTAAALARIDTRLGVIDAKLDAMREEMKPR